MSLQYVDPERPPSTYSRILAAFSATAVGRVIARKLIWPADPVLLKLTRGHFSFSKGLPTALLETRGARSGEPRSNALLYFHDGDRVTIIASKAGASAHPAWFHNLRANPDVTFGGVPMFATIVTDLGETARLWKLADRVFAPFAQYRAEAAKAGRTIPIVQLRARG